MLKIVQRTLPVLFVCALTSSVYGQSQTLRLKSGDYTIESTTDLTWQADELIDNHFQRIIVFETIPDQATKARIEAAGIDLLDYLPNNAYFASISTSVDWTSLPSATVIPVLPEYKLSSNLAKKEYPHWTLFGTDQIELIATYYSTISEEQAKTQLTEFGATIASTETAVNTINVRVKLTELDALYALDAFSYFSVLPSEAKPENHSGRTNHRSNTLWTEYGTGLEYSGDGVTVMMQDDGIIGPHIDYEGRIDQSGCSGCSTNAANDHGDHVSGTIMGAGNLNPRYRGMAHGAELLVYGSANSNYTSVPNLYDNDSLVITSKSYSNGCNDGYTSWARTLDQQIRQRPSLMHVFSAGNNGASACSPNDYGAGPTWGNITGGHKMGKNLLTVGNLTQYDALSSSSSRGPATDGRIKPDICAVGSSVTSTGPDNIYFTISGTSMACPGISGILAQLYEGYRDLNGVNPNSGLIKASVLNTAEDLGNPGPDFRYGWGRVNARQAFDLISSNQYISGSLGQGDTDQHTISVPAGVSELRVMVYWTDYEGATNSNPSLVNDINMVVTDPGMVDYDPWKLDHTPANVNDVAIRAVDNLNNMEQVTLDNPAAGNYEISLDGFSIPQGPQEYYVVYYFVRDEINVTFPIGGEGIGSASSEIVRWDAPEGTDPFVIEYTLDDGASWQPAGSANADKRYFSWVVPNTVTGLARVRVTRNTESDVSDDVFSIIGVPNNIQFDWICPDSSGITWDAVSGATGYEVSMLGAKYMDAIGTTSTNSLTVPYGSAATGWFSVRALGPDNARGERAVAIQKPTGELNCIWSLPTAGFEVDCPESDAPGGTGHCFDFVDLSVNTDGTSQYMWYFPTGTPSTSTDPNPTVCFDTPGYHEVDMVVTNGAGTDSIHTTNLVYVSQTHHLPYFEGFESTTSFLNNDHWSTTNGSGTQPFLITTDAALLGNKSARLFNYSQNGNHDDELISGPVDLSTLAPTDIMTLTFRYSYRKKQSSNDEWLKVFVRESCEDSWVQRKTLHGDQLTTLTQTSSWIPSSDSDWTTVHMTNITSQYFTGDFRFKFKFESDGGNNFYIDNINLYEGSPTEDIISGLDEMAITNAQLYPNPTDGELNIEFDLNAAQVANLTIVDLTGKELESHAVNGQIGKNVAFVNVNTLSSGVYFMKIDAGNVSHQMRFVIQ